MNGWQAERQMEYLLKKWRWENSASNNLVFEGRAVIVCPDTPEHIGKMTISPIVQITPLGHQVDPDAGEEFDYNVYRYKVQVLVANANDQFGRAALIGASITGATSSRGRGLDEVLHEVQAALSSLRPSTGVAIIGTPQAGSGVLTDEQRIFFAYRDLELAVYGTNSRFYHTADNLRATAAGLDVTLGWSLPPDRFDLYRLILRRASGSTPPATITDGTGVTITGGLPWSGMSTSVVDTVSGAGTYSYSLFVQYDETRDPPSAADRTVVSTVTLTV